MKKNMGTLDRGLRLVVAVALTALYLSGLVDGLVLIAGSVVSLIFLITSAVGVCPLYFLLGISTCSRSLSS